MRIILAVTIVIWHVYLVTHGSEAAVALWSTTALGPAIALLLPIFFALSGFLIAGSMYRNANIRTFLILRGIRIYPALVVEVLLSAFILGPLLTTFDLEAYFTDRKFLSYLANTVGWVHFLLPGVFAGNPVPETVNAQLWTVPYELECYVLIAVISFLGFFAKRTRVLPIFIGLTLVVAASLILGGEEGARAGGWAGRVLVLCFLAGVLIYTFKDKIPWRTDYAVIALVTAALLPTLHDSFVYIVPLPIAYATVVFGLYNPRRTMLVNSGDYSYGVYLYHFPILQAAYHFIGAQATFATVLFASLPVIVIFALFSWWCVEKPFLGVRKLVLNPKSPAAPKG